MIQKSKIHDKSYTVLIKDVKHGQLISKPFLNGQTTCKFFYKTTGSVTKKKVYNPIQDIEKKEKELKRYLV